MAISISIRQTTEELTFMLAQTNTSASLVIGINRDLTLVDYGVILRFFSDHCLNKYVITEVDHRLSGLLSGFVGYNLDEKDNSIVDRIKDAKYQIACELKEFIKKNRHATPDFSDRGKRNIKKITNYINSTLALDPHIDDIETLIILEVYDSL